MKKFFNVFFPLLAMLFPVTASAYSFCVDGIYYSKNGSNASVTYETSSYNSYSGDIVIPEYVTYSGISYRVTAIDARAFSDCSNLTSVFIPNSVISIGMLAFTSCSSLTSISIPSSVSFIYPDAFFYCQQLRNITVASNNPVYDSRDNCNAIIETASNKLIQGCINTSIPNSITTIGKNAFAFCSGLTNIDIPNSVTSIEERAFDFCTGLTSVSIPNSVVTIGYGAFQSCSEITSLTIPNSVVSIGGRAFTGLKITSLTIPSSVTSIGEHAFINCTKLNSIIVENGNPNYDSRENCNALIETSSNRLIKGSNSTRYIPNSITSICDNAFQGCTGLTSIYIPSSVSNIGEYAFSGCTGLSNLTIPNSVLTIGQMAFYINRNLNLTICGNIESIGSNAFKNISSLYITNGVTSIPNLSVSPNNIYSYSSIPPLCIDGTFSAYSGTLHVPAASLASYFTASYWSNFANIIGNAVEPTELTINQNVIELQIGNQFSLSTTVIPSNAYPSSINWISTNTTVATVNYGIVSAIGVGECDIIATCLDKYAICHVVVTQSNITIFLDQEEIYVLPNHIAVLTPSASSDVIPELITNSSDPMVAAARVMNGKVQVVGIKEGTSTITVGSVDGTAIPATCLVTVYTEPGDLNCDGFRNISDVTALINYLLSGNDSQISTKNADVNENGRISISDVTTLINILLNGN